MEPKFWIEAWEIGKTGFHMNDYNKTMLNVIPSFELKPNENILVPLCGKSLDMIWLKDQGLNVYGVELSELAILDFFKENKLEYTTTKLDDFLIFKSERITIFCGDIFKLNSNHLPEINAIYDRAAIVALPESMRSDYINKLWELSSDKVNILLLSFERTPHTEHGPPHSIPRLEMEKNLKEKFNFKIIETSNEKIKSKLLRENGINTMLRVVYHLTKTN